jgi:PAS domain S-box-containing protein
MSDSPGILSVDDAALLATQLFENSPDCMKLLDADGRLLAMNRNGRLCMEIDDFAAVKGALWLSFFPEESQAAVAAAVAQAQRGETAHASAFCPTAKGMPKWWDIVVSPLGDGAGKLVAVSRDVTAQRRARLEHEHLLKEVQAANDRMNDVFKHAPAFMCILRGPEHVYEMVNDRYYQLVGERRIVGLPAREALPEIAGQGFFERLDQVYRTGVTFIGNNLRVQLQRRPGAPLEERYVDVIYTALRDAGGRIYAVLSHGIDQTQRYMAEIALQESRERFQKLVSQAATGVVELDVDGRITLVNQKFCQMLGYTEAELVGASVIDITAPDSVQTTLATVGRVLAEGTGQVLDKHYRRKDGSLQPATSSVNALRNAAGECHGMVAIVLDTTDSQRAAEALRASEERYRTLFDSMDQAFCLLELEFDGAGAAVDGVFLETNAAFTLQTGMAGVVGKRRADLATGIDDWWLEAVGEVAKNGGSRRFERGSATLGRWFDVYLTRVGGEGSSKVAALFRDITKRKLAEEQLRRFAADLEEADRRKTDFLATLAHELRNPLAPIRSGLGVMRLNRDATPAMARVREMMERQVGHMVHLIDDLLDVARISGGKLNLRKSEMALAPILGSAVETSLPLIEAAHHELAIAMPDHELYVLADATRIAQVVANLLNNAAKYTPPGGRIALALRREGGDAVITVTDTGVGIPQHALQTVFDMFSQVGSERERSQGGLGIGLSLVRQLVQMHGGSVVGESAGPGAGSRFTVRLPLVVAIADAADVADAADSPAAAAAPEADAAAGLRVLVVDDNVDAAVTLAMILDVEGNQTRVAHDGREAVSLAAEFKPEVVFLDIGMPGMNGYETAEAIRRLPGIAQPCLVALTGWGAEHDRARSAAAGFDHHLTKPVEFSTVQALLAQVKAPA